MSWLLVPIPALILGGLVYLFKRGRPADERLTALRFAIIFAAIFYAVRSILYALGDWLFLSGA